MKLIKQEYGNSNDVGTNGAFDRILESSDSESPNSYMYYNLLDNEYNNWRDMTLNKVNLNTNYYNYLTKNVSGISTKLVNYVWAVGGTYANNTVFAPNVKSAYDYELGTKKLKLGDDGCYTSAGVARKCIQEDLTYQDEIGLIYVSDYGYSVLPELWNTNLYDAIATKYGSSRGAFYPTTTFLVLDSNFRFGPGWFITAVREDSISTFIPFNRRLASAERKATTEVKPTFYLTNDTVIKSGKGLVDDPYRLAL